MKLMERAPERIAAALLSQPVGHRPEKPDYMYDVRPRRLGQGIPRAAARCFDGDHREVSAQPVPRAARLCVQRVARLREIVPDADAGAARRCRGASASCLDRHRLARPNAEITVFPWKDPPELKARTINRARTFLKQHVRRKRRNQEQTCQTAARSNDIAAGRRGRPCSAAPTVFLSRMSAASCARCRSATSCERATMGSHTTRPPMKRPCGRKSPASFASRRTSAWTSSATANTARPAGFATSPSGSAASCIAR